MEKQVKRPPPIPPWTATRERAARAAVRFGRRLVTGSRHISVHMGDDNMLVAVVIVTCDRLQDPPVDYRAQVRISDSEGEEAHVRFTGYVENVERVGRLMTVHCVADMTGRRQRRISGLALEDGTNALEAVWSLLRLEGVDPRDIRIEGYRPTAPAEFTVSSPVDGVEVSKTVDIGGVSFTRDRPPTSLTEVGREWTATYRDADVWSVVGVTARTLYDAEVAGLRRIETALGIISALGAFSHSSLPGGELTNYEREWADARPIRRPIVLVKRLGGAGGWLRGTEDNFACRALPIAPMVGRLRDVPQLPLHIEEAVLSWASALYTDDLYQQVMDVWQAIEFYIAKISVEPLFTKATVSRLAVEWSRTLTGAQAVRAREVAQQLNNAPVFVRLEAALDADGIPYSQADLELLKRLRRIRNDLVHGRPPDYPSSQDVKYGLSFVARLLIYRLWHLAAGAA